MFVMVIGCGRLGAGLARLLSTKGNDVVVVSEKIDARWLGSDFDGVTVEGDPVDGKVLESAGIRKADLFVAATATDVVNAMAAQLAKEVFRVPIAIARMADPAREAFYRGMGLDTVCPTTTGINQILDTIQRSGFASLKAYLDPDIAGISLPSNLIGKKVAELPLPQGRRLIGIERRGRIAVPEDAATLAKGDVLILRRGSNPEKKK